MNKTRMLIVFFTVFVFIAVMANNSPAGADEFNIGKGDIIISAHYTEQHINMVSDDDALSAIQNKEEGYLGKVEYGLVDGVALSIVLGLVDFNMRGNDQSGSIFDIEGDYALRKGIGVKGNIYTFNSDKEFIDGINLFGEISYSQSNHDLKSLRVTDPATGTGGIEENVRDILRQEIPNAATSISGENKIEQLISRMGISKEISIYHRIFRPYLGAEYKKLDIDSYAAINAYDGQGNFLRTEKIKTQFSEEEPFGVFFGVDAKITEHIFANVEYVAGNQDYFDCFLSYKYCWRK